MTRSTLGTPVKRVVLGSASSQNAAKTRAASHVASCSGTIPHVHTVCVPDPARGSPKSQHHNSVDQRIRVKYHFCVPLQRFRRPGNTQHKG